MDDYQPLRPDHEPDIDFTVRVHGATGWCHHQRRDGLLRQRAELRRLAVGVVVPVKPPDLGREHFGRLHHGGGHVRKHVLHARSCHVDEELGRPDLRRGRRVVVYASGWQPGAASIMMAGPAVIGAIDSSFDEVDAWISHETIGASMNEVPSAPNIYLGDVSSLISMDFPTAGRASTRSIVEMRPGERDALALFTTELPVLTTIWEIRLRML